MLKRGGKLSPTPCHLSIRLTLGMASIILSLSYHICNIEMHKPSQQAGRLGGLKMMRSKHGHSVNKMCFS